MADKTSPMLEEEELLDAFGQTDNEHILNILERLKSLNRAALKKIAEWGEEWCWEHRHEHPVKTKKRMCDECWQLLLEKEG